jgi:hypothetical protein
MNRRVDIGELLAMAGFIISLLVVLAIIAT